MFLQSQLRRSQELWSSNYKNLFHDYPLIHLGGNFIWYVRPFFFNKNWNETCFSRENKWLIEETGYHSWDSEPSLRLRENLWLSPFGSQLRDPCSWPQAVYQDLKTRHALACIKSPCSIGQFEPTGGSEQGSRRRGFVSLFQAPRYQCAEVVRVLFFP